MCATHVATREVYIEFISHLSPKPLLVKCVSGLFMSLCIFGNVSFTAYHLNVTIFHIFIELFIPRVHLCAHIVAFKAYSLPETNIYKTRIMTSQKAGFMVFSKEQQNHDSGNQTNRLLSK